MIRLIASDMDGTLLDCSKNLPPGFFSVMRRLQEERGIRFLAASGRQYYNLLKIFEPIAASAAFMSENGALVFHHGENLFRSEIAPENVRILLKKAACLERVFPTVCGVRAAYIRSDDPVFLENARLYYEKLEFVREWEDVFSRDAVCKLAFYDASGAEQNSYPVLSSLGGLFQIVVAGPNWLDVMNPGVNKGSALRRLQELWHISPDESMGFGDYPNDLEMLRNCYYSYAMANAHPAILKEARFRAPSNDEYGVMKIIEGLFTENFADF